MNINPLSRINVKNSTQLICSILRELPVGCTISVEDRSKGYRYSGIFVKTDGHKITISNPYKYVNIPHWHPYKVVDNTVYLEFDAVLFNFHHPAIFAAMICAEIN